MVVVDLRGEDRESGHIAGTVHVPDVFGPAHRGLPVPILGT